MKTALKGEALDEHLTDVVIADLMRARWNARTLRLWCHDQTHAEPLRLAIDKTIADAGGDPGAWRLDIIAKDVDGAELARLGYLDAAFCGDKLAILEAPARNRFIEALSRLIATDGYVFAEGLGERLRDRFTRDAAAATLYRPTALTLDLSFL